MQAKNGENWRMGFWLFTHTTRVRGTFRNRELDKKDISRNEWTKLHFPLCFCFLVELLPTCKTLQTAKGFRFSESECPLSHLSHSLFAHSPSVPNQPHFPLHSLQSQVNTQYNSFPFSHLHLSHFTFFLSVFISGEFQAATSSPSPLDQPYISSHYSYLVSVCIHRK